MNMYLKFVCELDPVEQLALYQLLQGERQYTEFHSKRTSVMTDNVLQSLLGKYLTISKNDTNASFIVLFNSLDYNADTVTCEFNDSIPTEPLFVTLNKMIVDPTQKAEIQWNVNVVQQRIIIAMLTKSVWLANEENYFLSMDVLRQICPNLRETRIACGNLMNLQFTIDHNYSYAFSEFSLEDDGVHFLLNPIISWNELQKQFADLNPEQLFKIKSNRTMQLYTTLTKESAQQASNNTVVITLEELRKKLGIPENEYAKLTDFRRRVIDPAIAEIQQYLTKDVSYAVEPDDKKTIRFTFTPKNNEDNPLE